MLRRTLRVSLAIALFMPILLRADDAPKGDKDLEGDWELVSHVYDGKDSPPAPVKDTVLTFKGDGLTTKTGDSLEVAARLDYMKKLEVSAREMFNVESSAALEVAASAFYRV
jgi:hypothetical protein